MFTYLLLLPALVGAQTVFSPESDSSLSFSGTDVLSSSGEVSSGVVSASMSISGLDTEPTSSESASASDDVDEGSISSALSSVVASDSASSTGTYSPFPLPSHKPLPPLFPPSDPLKPPSVDKSPGGDPSKVVLPDFAPAWIKAYRRAQEQVRRVLSSKNQPTDSVHSFTHRSPTSPSKKRSASQQV